MIMNDALDPETISSEMRDHASDEDLNQCMVKNDVLLDSPKDKLECDGIIACEQSQATSETKNKVSYQVTQSKDEVEVRWLSKDDFHNSGI